jgi:acetylornithine deacetylase/succinyl-diaminopimelate desuccinylase-like protein
MPNTTPSHNVATQLIKEIWLAAQGNEKLLNQVTFKGEGELPSAFAVTDLAAAAMGAAGLALSSLLDAMDSVSAPGSVDPNSADPTIESVSVPAASSTNSLASKQTVIVDRRLASFWFAYSLRPIGWKPPSAEDFVMGDYQTRDGCIPMPPTTGPRRCGH